MKKLLALLLLFSVHAHAGDFFDGATVLCQKGDVQLNIEGSKWLFGSRSFTLAKAGHILLQDSYSVQDYTYNERLGFYSPEVSDSVRDLTTTVYQLTGRALGQSDFRAYVSEEANFYLFIDNLNPAYGGKRSAIVLKTSQGGSISFDLEKECRSAERSLRTW